MVEKINIVVGFDQREAIAYHVFTQSILEKASLPVTFHPLAINTLSSYSEKHTDRSNDFVYSRFLTPYLNHFQDWAIFADGDMVCLQPVVLQHFLHRDAHRRAATPDADDVAGPETGPQNLHPKRHGIGQQLVG